MTLEESGAWQEVALEPGQSTTLTLWPATVWKFKGAFTLEVIASNTVRLTMLEEEADHDGSHSGEHTSYVG